MSDQRAAEPILLSDALDWIVREIDAREERNREIAELCAIAAPHIDPSLALALHAQCATRGIDWRALLADATNDVLNPPQSLN